MTENYTTMDLSRMVRDALVNTFGIDPALITAEANMRDLGVDSMHVVEILLDLEKELGVTLTDLSFPSNPTLEQVAQTIGNNLRQSPVSK
jgi:acyl carrier protein